MQLIQRIVRALCNVWRVQTSNPPVRKKIAATIGGGAVALAVAMIAPFEGLETKSYRDIVGIWTVCYGETRGVTSTSQYTPAQCKTMLSERVAEFDRAIDKCLPKGLSDPTRASFISLAYNIGSHGFCSSSISRHAMNGNLPQACENIKLYNKARVMGKLQSIRGLTLRRKAESDLCKSGL